MLLADQCCDLLFTECRPLKPAELEGVAIPVGRTLWVADADLEDLTTGECVRLAGILTRNPNDQRLRLKVCNCPSVCWLTGAMVREPETGRVKFKAEIPQDCCQCEVQLETRPCCYSSLTVPEDCYGVTSYDTCAPPTYAGQGHGGVGLCYPRGTDFTITFPASITCDEVVLYFDHAEMFVCSQTLERFGQPVVALTLPTEDTCPGRCEVRIIAYYGEPCCQCELRLTADPPNSEAVTISPNDCDGDGPTVTWGADLCYPHGQVVDVDIPYTFEQGGHTYYLDYVEYSRCDYQTPYRVVWTSFEIHMPTDDRCPGEGRCWVRLHAVYRIGCNDGTCDTLLNCLASGHFTFDAGYQLPLGDCGDIRCAGCWSWITEAAQNYFDGLVVPLARQPGTCELNHYSGRLEEAVCYVSGQCEITRYFEYQVRLRVTEWHWDCHTGLTRIKGRLDVNAGAYVEVPFECGAHPPCEDCSSPSISGSAYMGATYNEWATIGTFESLGEAICATRDWLNAKEWVFNTLSGHGPIDGSVVVEGECCELPE